MEMQNRAMLGFTVTPRLQAEFDDYASVHQTFGNQVTHYIGIPIIVICMLGLFHLVALTGPLVAGVPLTLGVILWLGGFCFYLYLDWRMALLFAPVTLAFFWIGVQMPVWLLWTLFIGGWILQFVGHGVYEKKSPAFYKNLPHLFVGPMWIFAKLLGIYKPAH